MGQTITAPNLNGWTTEVDERGHHTSLHRTTWAKNMREHRRRKRQQAEDRLGNTLAAVELVNEIFGIQPE